MRGPCGPQRDSPSVYAVIIAIPEPRVYLIVHYTELLYCTTNLFHSGEPKWLPSSPLPDTKPGGNFATELPPKNVLHFLSLITHV